MFKSTKILLRCGCIVCSISLIFLFTFSSFAKVTINVSQFQMGNMFKAVTHFKALGVEVNKNPTMSNGIYNWIVDKYPAYNGKVGNYTNIFRESDNGGKQAQNVFEIGVKGYLQPPASRPDIPLDQSNYYLTIVILTELDDTQGYSFTKNIQTPTNAIMYMLNENGDTYDGGIAMDLIGQKKNDSTVASVYSVSIGGASSLTNLITYGAAYSLYYGFEVPYNSFVSILNWNFMRPLISVSYDAETSEAIGTATYDLLSNDVAPTLKNTEALAGEILSSQQEMNKNIEQVPDKVADAIEKKENQAAESGEAAFNNAKNEIEESNPIPFNSLADSLNKLVLAAGSLERCHSLEFPAIILPQIGSNDAMTVSEKQTVDFDQIIDEMPSVLVVGARLVNSAFLYWGVIVFIKRTLEGVFET
jgi:hypothetical protein